MQQQSSKPLFSYSSNETQLVYQSQGDTLANSKADSKHDGPATGTTTTPLAGEQCTDPPVTTDETETTVAEYSVIKLDQFSSTPTTEQGEYSIIGLDQVGSTLPTVTVEYANMNTSKHTTAPIPSEQAECAVVNKKQTSSE